MFSRSMYVLNAAIQVAVTAVGAVHRRVVEPPLDRIPFGATDDVPRHGPPSTGGRRRPRAPSPLGGAAGDSSRPQALARRRVQAWQQSPAPMATSACLAPTRPRAAGTTLALDPSPRQAHGRSRRTRTAHPLASPLSRRISIVCPSSAIASSARCAASFDEVERRQRR